MLQICDNCWYNYVQFESKHNVSLGYLFAFSIAYFSLDEDSQGLITINRFFSQKACEVALNWKQIDMGELDNVDQNNNYY